MLLYLFSHSTPPIAITCENEIKFSEGSTAYQLNRKSVFLRLLYFNIVHICTLRGNSNIFNSSSSLSTVPSRSNEQQRPMFTMCVLEKDTSSCLKSFILSFFTFRILLKAPFIVVVVKRTSSVVEKGFV